MVKTISARAHTQTDRMESIIYFMRSAREFRMRNRRKRTTEVYITHDAASRGGKGLAVSAASSSAVRDVGRSAVGFGGTMRGRPSLPPTAGGGAFGSILRLTFSYYYYFIFGVFLSLSKSTIINPSLIRNTRRGGETPLRHRRSSNILIIVCS